MDRRRFLGLFGLGAGVAAAAPLVALVAAQEEEPPRLWNDGLHDDTAAIQWRIDRFRGVNLQGGVFRTEGPLVLGGQATISDCYILGGKTAIVINGEALP